MTPTAEPGALAASLGHVPTDPTWPADTRRTPVPMTLFGTDHWSTFAYVETRTVDHKGLLDHDRMRCHAGRHPVMLRAKRRVSGGSADGSRYPTRIKASATPDPDGRYGVTEVPDHDDYDCLDDLIAAGLLEPRMPVVGAGGWYVDAAHGYTVSAAGGVIRPESVTGLDEQVLATRAVWTLTADGLRVAGELRAFEAAGGALHDFMPRNTRSCGDGGPAHTGPVARRLRRRAARGRRRGDHRRRPRSGPGCPVLTSRPEPPGGQSWPGGSWRCRQRRLGPAADRDVDAGVESEGLPSP
jgi:hypothetical protein